MWVFAGAGHGATLLWVSSSSSPPHGSYDTVGAEQIRARNGNHNPFSGRLLLCTDRLFQEIPIQTIFIHWPIFQRDWTNANEVSNQVDLFDA